MIMGKLEPVEGAEILICRSVMRSGARRMIGLIEMIGVGSFIGILVASPIKACSCMFARCADESSVTVVILIDFTEVEVFVSAILVFDKGCSSRRGRGCV